MFEILGSICSLCLFILLSKTSIIALVPSPAFQTYNSLESIHSSTLRCPCSNKAIPYKNFLSLSPMFHPICSSSFVHKNWIEILKLNTVLALPNDWFKKAYIQFQILSDLCQLANMTIIDAIDRFLNQFFIASSVAKETNFAKQLNATLGQFYQSTIYSFVFLKDITNLIMQVDQFYMGVVTALGENAQLDLMTNVITNETSNHQAAQVCQSFCLPPCTPITNCAVHAFIF